MACRVLGDASIAISGENDHDGTSPDALVTILALLLYFATSLQADKARGRPTASPLGIIQRLMATDTRTGWYLETFFAT